MDDRCKARAAKSSPTTVPRPGPPLHGKMREWPLARILAIVASNNTKTLHRSPLYLWNLVFDPVFNRHCPAVMTDACPRPTGRGCGFYPGFALP